jgi:hypothetical protein
MPITSLTCTSRQARTHSPHWMQASRLTRMATWLSSSSGMRILLQLGKAAFETPLASAMSHRCAGAVMRRLALWLIGQQHLDHHLARALLARGAVGGHDHALGGWRMQEAASVRSPSTSTMQARQLPSGR